MVYRYVCNGFLRQIRLESYQPALPVPRILVLCNHLQNVVATTYIFRLQLSTFIFYNKQEDGWAIYSNYKVQIGNQADGLEKVVLLDSTDEDWIYYTSNMLIKAKPDGTEQVVLDGVDDFWYQIDKIEGGWIYYQKGNDKYKIDINGNNKVKIE